MKKTLAMGAIVALVFIACNAIEKRTNDPKDIAEATKVADEFINNVKAKNYDKAMELTTISEDNPEHQKHINIFKDLNNKLGEITGFKQDTAAAIVAQEGNHIEGVIDLQYTVNYQRGQTKESYTLQYDDDGKIIVRSYAITTQ
ncbi:MAG: hypothetical protein M0D57_11450 [Sphingobacteriales bacterium JAD_PAG50586_3]|nr:MAG: hypothetical protein M0D57_11450 [Sphingobacteriales bacterium JAD_PAG50586_3]